ncbi:maltose O-acetyltransferase [Breznakibacter xylanolyticus]|uniref:Maltose O-acetyltransferase n=1 Tax=Breznakibacter xylanolyticus TaxID=990 RepID=A0A2W7NSP4_9BACT|nr:acyltransferase [Breznakibacter xylanolyticus]MBN2744051.1 acyltransferase [Marinilabiliaceae bacterium]PZX14272.1 maltose O-acetyltransferase [Breznakibacter xylanolyticus]
MILGGIKTGDEVNIYPSVSFNHVVFGNNLKIGKECQLFGAPDMPLLIGDNTIIGMYVIIDGSCAKIHIGKNVSIAQQTVIVADWQVVDGSKTAGYFAVKSAPITIGNNTWIGSSCVIAPGVTIGECCIIATNSYVAEDVPSYSVYGGSPARLIKVLNPEELG